MTGNPNASIAILPEGHTTQRSQSETPQSPLQQSDILAYFQQGCRPKEEWRIGTEHEKFLYNLEDGELLPYRSETGKVSVETILKSWADRHSWTPIYEGENIIALTKGKYSINVEPGGQIELSGAPMLNLHQAKRELGRYMDELREICKENNTGILAIGFHPSAKIPQKASVPRTRFKALDNQSHRHDFKWSYLTCSVQTNLDYGSEADMIKKLRVSLALQPLIVALFANSPFAEGKASGYKSYRYHLSTTTHQDQQRRFMDLAFSDDMSFEAYADFVMREPMMFAFRNGVYHTIKSGSFIDFYNGRMPDLPSDFTPTLDDFIVQISSVYSDVRLRNYIEMRGADAGGWRQLIALPAIWTGLLYDEQALEEAWQMVRRWSPKKMMEMRFLAAEKGVGARMNIFQSFQSQALKAVTIAYHGLRRRDVRDPMNEDETVYLDHAMTHAAIGRSRAALMIEELETKCDGDFMKFILRHSMQTNESNGQA